MAQRRATKAPVKNAKHFDEVVANAVEFLDRSVGELTNGNLKFSAVFFYQAVELFIKARLLREHWSLVVIDPGKADLSAFERGDFQSVNLKQAVDRLRGVSGKVEADETYIGGRRRGDRRGRPAPGSHKVPVFGMVQRGGDVVVRTVPNVKKATLMPHMTERVLPASIVYTDELKSYDGVEQSGYQHRRIHHATRVYVSGDIHTNTIEGFWSLVKNGIRGVYHSVSAKHLQSYLSEYAWRYNRRNSGEAKFLTLLLRSADAA